MSYQDRGIKFVRYYWCVNCGHNGDFGFERERNLRCEKCGYDSLTELDKEEYEHDLNKGINITIPDYSLDLKEEV